MWPPFFFGVIPTYGVLPYAMIMYGDAYSTSSFRGTEHAFSFNFIVCRELVMTVNIPVHERDATCRIVASAGSSTRAST